MTDGLTPGDLPGPEFEGLVDIETLETDGANPNEMTDEQFGLLVDRMAENGWLGGPIVTDTDGLIADGEHRWRAAQENGLAEVPVRQYDIDDATRRLWRQELNKIHGEHDSKRDALEYDALLSEGYTEEVEALTDAADEDLDELLAELKMDNGSSPAYEYDPEHNVYFEDCVGGMRERLDDDSVDMVFTSPPYNVDLQDGRFDGGNDDAVMYQDSMTDDEYREFISDIFAELRRVVKPSGHIFWNVNHEITDGRVLPRYWMVEEMDLPLKSYIVWKKGNNIGGYANLGLQERGQFMLNWEPIYHFSEEPNSLYGSGNKCVWDVPPVDAHGEHDVHPAAYPVELVRKAMLAVTSEDDTVLDPFMGSGTTAVAAIQNDRDYVGFELDEEGAYKPIIERRIGEAKRQREASVNQEEAGADD